jgi:hypothetical protein
VFQFLCFFKIIEGLRVRRERLAKEALAVGRTPSRPLKEVIPAAKAEFVPWLLPLLHVNREWNEMTLTEIFVPEALGQKINRLIDDHLRPLRNRVAHGALDEGEPVLSADEAMDLREVYKWLPLTKCIVRRMLKNEFPNEFLSYIKEDGTVVG